MEKRMKGNQKVFMTQVSVGSEKNWYILARQQKLIQGINSPLAPYPLSVILPRYLISKLRPQIPPGRSLSFHSLKIRDLLLHSRNTYILLLRSRARMLQRLLTPLCCQGHPPTDAALGVPRRLGCLRPEEASRAPRQLPSQHGANHSDRLSLCTRVLLHASFHPNTASPSTKLKTQQKADKQPYFTHRNCVLTQQC